MPREGSANLISGETMGKVIQIVDLRRAAGGKQKGASDRNEITELPVMKV
jgi:hypothetical protein